MTCCSSPGTGTPQLTFWRETETSGKVSSRFRISFLRLSGWMKSPDSMWARTWALYLATLRT
ncbi:hypothetical protein D3C78_1911380 [compost metagenome]